MNQNLRCVALSVYPMLDGRVDDRLVVRVEDNWRLPIGFCLLRLFVFLWRLGNRPHVHCDFPVWSDHGFPELREDDRAVRTHEVVVAFLNVRSDHINVQEALFDQALHSLPCLTRVPRKVELPPYGILEPDWSHVSLSANNTIYIGVA